MDKTIIYSHCDRTYLVNVSNPYKPERYTIKINGVLTFYAQEKDLIRDMDGQLATAIDRYQAERDIGIIPQE